MKAFIAVKYKSGENNELIKTISSALKGCGIEPYCFARDFEYSNKKDFSSKELMEKAFEHIRGCDMMVLDVTEIAVGVGIEAGYAYSLGIPILTIAQKDSEIFNTLKGISEDYLFYNGLEEIKPLLMEYFRLEISKQS